MTLWLLIACGGRPAPYPPADWAVLPSAGSALWATSDAPHLLLAHGAPGDGAPAQLRLLIDEGRAEFSGLQAACIAPSDTATGAVSCDGRKRRELAVSADGDGLIVSVRGEDWPPYVPSSVRMARVSPIVVAFEVLRPGWSGAALPAAWSPPYLHTAIAAAGTDPTTWPLDRAVCLRRALEKGSWALGRGALDADVLTAELLSRAIQTCAPRLTDAAAPRR